MIKRKRTEQELMSIDNKKPGKDNPPAFANIIHPVPDVLFSILLVLFRCFSYNGFIILISISPMIKTANRFDIP